VSWERILGLGLVSYGDRDPEARTVLTIDLGCNDELIRRELGFDSLDYFENKPGPVLEASSVLDIYLATIDYRGFFFFLIDKG
jgi:hypothetical protein